MSGEVVPLKPSTDAETDLKKRLLKWRVELAEQVLRAVREDGALHFLDNVDDEDETSTFDLRGAYDPIVDSKTGARLSDAIGDFAEEIGRSEKELQNPPPSFEVAGAVSHASAIANMVRFASGSLNVSQGTPHPRCPAGG